MGVWEKIETILNRIKEAIDRFLYVRQNEREKYEFSWDDIWFLGYRALHQGNYELAIEIFKMFTSQIQGSRSYYELGKAYKLNGNKELAIENFKQMLKLHPDHIRAKKGTVLFSIIISWRGASIPDLPEGRPG